MSRTDKKEKFKVVVPSGTSMVRMFHKNITDNTRTMTDPQIEVPSIVTRAKLVVRESRDVVIRESEG